MSDLLNQVLGKLSSPLAVLYGGESPEREVSLNSGGAVMAALDRLAIPYIAIDAVGDWWAQFEKAGCEYALIMLHGGAGENGEVQAFLAEKGVPFTGSDAEASRIAMDKHSAKNVFRRVGVSTADSITVYEGDSLDTVPDILGSKVIVKPVHEGSSVGMSIATDLETLQNAVNNALEFDRSILLEPFLSGPEYTVAILGEQSLPAIELVPDGDFYDYHAKYVSNNTRYICPANVSDELAETLASTAIKAFHSIGCSGWGRVDLMMDGDELYVLEVNTVPGMTDHSLVPKAAANAGIDFDQLVLRITAQAVLAGEGV